MVKNNKIKQKRVISEDMTNIRNMFIILFIVVLVVVGLYYLTENLVNKDKDNNTDISEVLIDYDIATIGTMFNRVEDEYYVLIYSNETNGSDLNSYLTTYRSSDDYIKTYYIDLDKKINSIAISDETNKYPTNSNEVKVNDATMYKIKNGKVVKTYCGVEDIKKVLNKDE